MLSNQLICNIFFTITLILPDADPNGVNHGLQDPCASVEISIDISQASNERSKASIKVKGAKSPILYFFSNAKGDLVSEDYNKATVENLIPGKYTCLVRDAGNCRKKIEFEIK